jgi:aminoglycoside/choline kinase family phosphotransferase
MNMKKYLESQLKNAGAVKKLRGGASTRNFFRVSFGNESLVAMVYPEENKQEIERIARLTGLYREYGLKVPEIKEIIGNRILLQEDLGDVLVQTAYNRFNKDGRKKLLERIADMVVTLSRIPPAHTAAILDTARMKWEMDFFVTHFVPHFCPPRVDTEDLREKLHGMVDNIGPIDTFAHRDFHSRNMLYYKEDIYLVDFQDSLKAPVYYDLVSFAFDAYLDLKSRRLRMFFMDSLKKRGLTVDDQQFLLTALQRNIKALGTFGFQVTVRRNLTYKKYIRRTIRHILNNPLFEKFLDARLFVI